MRVARLFLFVAVMGSVFSSGALAQVTIGIDGASLRVGEVVEIPIEINSVDGLDITSYQFTLLFPEDVLDIVGVETAGTLSEGKSVIVNTDTEGEIRVAMAGTNALSGSGSLLILSGIVTGDDLFGERIFTPRFDELLFFSSTSQSVAATSEIGSYSVKGIDIAISFLGSSAGNAFSLPITVGQTSGLDIGAYQFTVKYDSSVVSFSGVASANTISSAGNVTYNDNGVDKLLIGFAHTGPLDGAGNLLLLQGTRKTNADPGLRLAHVRLFNLDGQSVPVSPDGFEALVTNVTVAPGETDTLNVVLDGIDDLNIDGYQFTLAYDSDVITITEPTTEETLSRGKTIITNADIPGQLSAAWAGSIPLRGSGDLVGLKTEVLTDGDPQLRFLDYKLIGDVGNGTDGPPTFPDLVIDSLALSPLPVVAGEELSIAFLIRNEGDGDAPAFQTNVRLNTSEDEVSSADSLLYFCELVGLEAGAETDNCSSTVTIPGDLSAGQYYIWVHADVNKETGQIDESNDTANASLVVSDAVNALMSPVSNAKITRGYAEYVDADGDLDFEFHSGTDFISDVDNLDVYAAASGRVRTIPVGTYGAPEDENFGMGNVVIIDHTNELGIYTLYAHLESIDVVNGQQVDAGERIGKMGETGFTTGVHLHFEVKDRGVLSGSRADDSRPWGYTSLDSMFIADTAPNVPGHPSKYGFHNPLTFLQHPVKLLDAPSPVQVRVPVQDILSSPVSSDSTILAQTPVLGGLEPVAFVATRAIGDAWYNVHIPNRFDEGWSASGWIRGTQNDSTYAELNGSLERVQVAKESIAIYDSENESSAQVGFAYADGLTLPQEFVVLESTANWYRIGLPDFMSEGDGWVRDEDVLPATTSVGVTNELPNQVAVHLGPNYPNPFASTTQIPLSLEKSGTVSLRIYDMLGREVALLLNQKELSGQHTVRFDAAHLPNGVYSIVLHAEGKSYHRFMTVLR